MRPDGRRSAEHVRFLAGHIQDRKLYGVLMGCADVMASMQDHIDHLEARLAEELELGEYDD